ncbi:cytochrome P450 2J4-like isoform X3 [Sceloporus undulatus]|uniref:cytochrome P450 2J4-like isoform X3 n=1 Tax=Sceloporus undulatus TaxID=8520 RepID=UPI001C4AB769|nr:cytochrome P450 2J4-like isoform X3 [Sceloporus undulatus]
MTAQCVSLAHGRLTQEYGNFTTLWIGHYPIVILSGFQTVKEGLINHSEELNDRPMTHFILHAFKRKGIGFANGHGWKQQRRFGIVTMRNLGLGKKGMEHQIEEEAHRLVEAFFQAKGQPLDPSVLIGNAISSLISVVSFGYRFTHEDETFQKLMETIDTLARFGVSIPHASKGDPNTTFSEDNLAQCILELFIAGTETTSSTLQWGLLLMVANPDIQERVYKEMEEVLGSFNSISYQDRKKLPYTNAVIHEVQRAKYILPVGIPRRCSKDLNMLGFHIPRKTLVVTDLNSVLLDPKHWETPKEFNPNHFLDKEGNFITREDFLPFGAGARVCLGEQMARMELFLFFTHLLRAFRFQLPEGVKELNKDPVVGLSMHPHPYKLCAIPRSSL